MGTAELVGIIVAVANFAAALASAVAAVRSADAAEKATAIAKAQKHHAQRQLLLPLWEYMAKLRPIELHDVKPADVTNGINTLELIALCCESEVVDSAVIKRTFRIPYITLFDQIRAVPVQAGLSGKSGADLIRENRAAELFYGQLKSEHLSADQPNKLGA